MKKRRQMSDAANDTLLESMGQQLLRMGVADPTGRRLDLSAGQRFQTVVGRVCDPEPLICTDLFLGASMTDRLVRGIGALAMLCDATRLILAVSKDLPEVVDRIGEVARGTRVEVVPVPAASPMDRESLLCDLAQLESRSVSGAGLDRALVVDAVLLCDISVALEGRYPLRRTVSVTGCVREPSVLQAPLGTSFAYLVEACGGATTSSPLGWVPLHNGALTGRQAGWDAVVDLDTRGVVVLPIEHPLVRRATTPVTDQIRRIIAACVSCRVCTDACPVHLNGGSLQPHLVMQQIASAGAEAALHLSAPDGPIVSTLQCVECNVCSPLCPAALRPHEAVQEVAAKLKERGVSLADPGFALRPHPDRMGRRVGVQRLTDQLGLRPYSVDLVTARRSSSGQVIPDRITIPPRGPSGVARVPAVEVGEQVTVGEVLTLGPAGSDQVDLRCPVAGTVVAVDPDDGIVIEAR
jgi:Na+-translocating ferredoxin:NAD+ oxidoreductase RnfC subunit